MRDIRVLVVDDQEVYRSALSGLLEVVGGYVVVAQTENGERAAELARHTQVDLVFMDLRLPGIDGVAATRLIRGIHPAPEVILISTDVDALRTAEADRSGARAAVAKADLDPLWLERLRAELSR